MNSGGSKIAGTLLIIGGVQFIIALTIAEAIYLDYSVANNYISDLGVWSKSSAIVFNPSIILLGITILVASVYIERHYNLVKMIYLYVLSGVGTLGVGLFPKDTFLINGVPVPHTVSALLAFVIGGATAAATYKITKSPFRYLSAILGIATLVAFVVFLTTIESSALGLGVGGLERMMAYPTLLWIVSFGGYLTGNQPEK